MHDYRFINASSGFFINATGLYSLQSMLIISKGVYNLYKNINPKIDLFKKTGLKYRHIL